VRISRSLTVILDRGNAALLAQHRVRAAAFS
jgi:hypothetical protein